MYIRTRTVTRVSTSHRSCLQEATYSYDQAVIYEAVFLLQEDEVVVNKGQRMREARYAGSSYGQKDGVGLKADVLFHKRVERHARDAFDLKHNRKVNLFSGALPVPPRVGRPSQAPYRNLGAMLRTYLSGQWPGIHYLRPMHSSESLLYPCRRVCAHNERRARTRMRARHRCTYGRPA